jgi:hypothetical protein
MPKRKEERLQGQSYDGRVLHYQEVWGTHPPTLPGLGQRQRLVVESELKTFFPTVFSAQNMKNIFVQNRCISRRTFLMMVSESPINISAMERKIRPY